MNAIKVRTWLCLSATLLLITGLAVFAGCGGKSAPANQQTWHFDQASDYTCDAGVVSVNEGGNSLTELKKLPDDVFWMATYKDPRPMSGPEYHVAALAPDGGIVVVGDYADFSNMSSKVIVGRYDSNGQSLPGWPKFFAGPGSHWNEGQDVVVDAGGNITIAGYAVVLRLDPAGNPLPGWPRYFVGDDAIGTGVIMDSSGEIVVCGTPNEDVNSQITVVKYRQDGSTVEGWPKSYGIPGSQQNFAYDLMQDSDGNLVLAGFTRTGGNRDAALYKLDANGNVLPGWPKTWDSGSAYDDYFSVSQDSNGDYCIVGICQGTTEGDGKLLATRYNKEGDQLTSSGWPRVYEHNGLRDASPPDSWSGDVDSDGNIAAAATCQSDTNITTVKYTPAAVMAAGFPKVMNHPGYYEVTRSCTVDDMDNIYTVGYWEVDDGSHSDYTTFVAKYPPGAYSTAMPAVVTRQGVGYARLTAFDETLGDGNQGSVSYQLSPNGTDWYYYDGSRWTKATGRNQVNAAAEVNDNVKSFADEAGTGTLYVKAFLSSDGSQRVQLDSISVEYDE